MSWIKCSERMPDRLQRVLAVVIPAHYQPSFAGDGRNVEIAYCDQRDRWRVMYQPYEYGQQFTHWQPLPSPPEDTP